MTTRSARIAAVDLNGQLRGKRVAADAIDKPLRMPLSVVNVDLFGSDIEGSPLVFESGDQDGVLVPTGRGPVPMPWLARDTLLDLRMMTTDDGAPFAGDPRQALIAALAPFEARGETVIAAAELEFFLLANSDEIRPAQNPKNGQPMSSDGILSLRELDGLETFFDAVADGARAMGLPNHVITGEAAPGQFEITLDHGPALRMADDIILTKELIKGTAEAQGMVATFLPKPFATESGTGLHMHCSVLGKDGRNIFEDETAGDSPTLLHAIGGLLGTLRPSTAIIAPFPHSYARFVDHAHAPTSVTWGHENRTVALRVPGGPPSSRRIEHRVSGGDVNPYLLLAVMLGSMTHGRDHLIVPSLPVSGNAYDTASDVLHPSLEDALTDLPKLNGILPPLLLDNFARTKRQEILRLAKMTPDEALMATLRVA